MSLVGIQNVVASLAEDKAKLLVLVISLEEVADAVAQSVVIFLCLALELTAQALVKSLKVGVLTLQLKMDDMSLLTGLSDMMKLLLEVGGSCLKLLLFLCERVLDVLTLFLQHERILLAELILRHDAVNLHKRDLCLCGSYLCVSSLVVSLRFRLVT